MTVGELIKLLETCPDKELPVYFTAEPVSGYLTPSRFEQTVTCDHETTSGPCDEDCDGFTITCNYL